MWINFKKKLKTRLFDNHFLKWIYNIPFEECYIDLFNNLLQSQHASSVDTQYLIVKVFRI